MRTRLSPLKHKQINKRKLAIIKIVTLMLIIGVTFIYKDELPFKINRSALSAQEIAKQDQAGIDITKKETYAGLPVSDVSYHATDNAKGTVLFFPQIHRSMGTNALSKTNDGAEITQKETYAIMSYLMNKVPINLVMVEGELYGSVDEKDEVKDITEQENLLKSLHAQKKLLEESASLYSMKDLSLKEYLTRTQELIRLLERKSIIEGAPFALKAQGGNFNLVGAESQESYDQSSKIMQENIDLEDRLEQVLGYGGKSEKSTSARQSNQDEKNPFASISDVKKLKALLRESDKKVDAVVMEKRNQDAAANLAKAFEEYSTKLGIIQFGAAHEKGLLSELQKQGFNVVVITPAEVAK